ncbi:MAG: hypothetical protein WCC36_15125 [Gammaproteobacteria bacterium]
MTGAWIGGRLALVLPAEALRTVFGVFLVLLGAHYLGGAERRLLGRRRRDGTQGNLDRHGHP